MSTMLEVCGPLSPPSTPPLMENKVSVYKSSFPKYCYILLFFFRKFLSKIIFCHKLVSKYFQPVPYICATELSLCYGARELRSRSGRVLSSER